ncbi:hypothetical protein PAPYR_12869 [Paratrimastix pyriformis]|uniref:Uncharacterized protein n=1 Tax=Paratrimastix pyriformis TaxID=342808 RepID=A0ABQ8U175_9EUKA|nr:hypothetical protein PAPYR_12869 [Paratrimastix pyriformis]
MSNFPISGSVRFAPFPLHLCIGTDLERVRLIHYIAPFLVFRAVLLNYSWSGCGSPVSARPSPLPLPAESTRCRGPSCEFCRPGPSSCRTCYGIATPVSGRDRSGQSPFCFAAHWVRGSGGGALAPSFAEDAASSAVLFAARAISFAAERCWALSGLVPHPSFGPADPFASGRSVAGASQAAGDTAAVLDQRSAAPEGPLYGRWLSRSLGRRSAPGSDPISVGILTS